MSIMTTGKCIFSNKHIIFMYCLCYCICPQLQQLETELVISECRWHAAVSGSGDQTQRSEKYHQCFQLGIFGFRVKFVENIKSPACSDNICIIKVNLLSAETQHPALLEAWPSSHWDPGVQSYELLHGDSADSIGFLWEWGLEKLHSPYPSIQQPFPNDATSMRWSVVVQKDEIRPVLYM